MGQRAWAGALAVAGVLVVVVLVGWGATAGPGTVVRGDEPADHVPASVPPPPSASPPPVGGLQPGRMPEHHQPLVVTILVAVAILGAVVLVLVVLGLAAGRLADALTRRRGLGNDVDAPATTLAADGAASTSLSHAIAEQLAELAVGPPREAIAACWVRLEHEAARLGVAPRRSDTATDFVVRLLDGLGADRAAADGLAALYREARFSDHRMDEDDRARARTLLERLLTSLRVRA